MTPQQFRANYNVMQICGKKWVGKSTTNKVIVANYLENIKRKVLIYNVTGEGTYDDLRTIKINPIHGVDIFIGEKDKEKEVYKKTREYRQRNFYNLNKLEARCVIPIKDDGSNFSVKEKKDLLIDILTAYRNGLLIIEDIDNYSTRAQNQEIIGALSTNRHLKMDMIIVHQ